MIRSETFKFRISPVEEEALKKLAKKHNVSPSEYLRDLLRKSARAAGLLPELVIEQQAESDNAASIAA